MNESGDRITLTQRRARTSGVSKLEKDKLQTVDNSNTSTEDKPKNILSKGNGGVKTPSSTANQGSAKKVVVWVLIVIVLAVAAYFGLQKYLNNGGDSVTPTLIPSPTPDPTSAIVSSTVLADDLAVNAPTAADYSTENQTVGEEAEAATYSISQLLAQRYDSFQRIQFTIGGVDADDLIYPLTSAVYNDEVSSIRITFKDILEDTSGLDYDESVNVSDSVVSAISHITVEGNDEVYEVALTGSTGFYLHTYESGGDTIIALDVKEVETNDDPDTETTPTVAPTQTPDNGDTGSGANDEFSQADKSISATATGNTVKIASYNFFDGPEVFTYRLFLEGSGDPVPGTTVALDGTTLTMTVKNVSVDAIVGNGGSGSTDFAERGVSDINTVEITNSSNVSTFVFDLDAATDFRVMMEEEGNVLRLEIQH